MAPLTILSDTDVNALLHSLERQDILDLQESLGDALHYYSTSTEEDVNGCSSTYQPMRTALRRGDGSTTLFMPASSNDGLGVKIVTLSEPSAPSNGKSGQELDISNLSISSESPAVEHSTTSFDVPEDLSRPSSETRTAVNETSPRGSLTLLDKNGNPRALVNAEEITAFRTALASTMIFKKRANVHDVTVFGAGKQAYWHVRLALILRGPEIHHLNIVNRSFDNAHALIERLYVPKKAHLDSEPSTKAVVFSSTALARPKISILTPSHNEYTRLIKSTTRASSVIFCTTPSVEPLFPASYLTSTEGRKKGRYIAAIGSYKPHMIELHPDIIRQAVAPHHSNHHHKHAKQGGAVVVDSVEACLNEAGEIIQAGLGGREVVEIGELLMLKREAEKGHSAAEVSPGSPEESGVNLTDTIKPHKKDQDDVNQGLREWLERGNVIYKSVGLGLMDVVVGTNLVNMADQRGFGTRIQNF